jgi:hypothetical protein
MRYVTSVTYPDRTLPLSRYNAPPFLRRAGHRHMRSPIQDLINCTGLPETMSRNCQIRHRSTGARDAAACICTPGLAHHEKLDLVQFYTRYAPLLNREIGRSRYFLKQKPPLPSRGGQKPLHGSEREPLLTPAHSNPLRPLPDSRRGQRRCASLARPCAPVPCRSRKTL